MKINQLACLILALFFSHVLAAQVTTSGETLTAADVLAFENAEAEYKAAQKALKDLGKQQKKLLETMAAMDAQQKALAAQIEKLETGYDAINAVNPSKSKRKSSLPAGGATKSMQEAQMSFNLQYLQLQQQTQVDDRSYNSISNIMKTKHDTAKNSISNIR
jgi:tetrahydromethanopterin S-methyltransferase subunit H